jgi:hypothetical protein
MFEVLGLPYDKENRARVDVALREVLEIAAPAQCPEVWAAVKALTYDEREALAGRVGERLGTSA